MSPFLKILAPHPVGTLLLLVLLLFVSPELLTPEEKTLAVLTLLAVGLSIALLLELWSRRGRPALKKQASRSSAAPPHPRRPALRLGGGVRGKAPRSHRSANSH